MRDSHEKDVADDVRQERRGSLTQALHKVWGDALSATSGLEDELKRRLGCLVERSGLQHGSDELQRLATDLKQRLQRDREQVERRFDETVRHAITRLRDPLLEELASLRQRAERLGQRIDRQLGREIERRRSSEEGSSTGSGGSSTGSAQDASQATDPVDER